MQECLLREVNYSTSRSSGPGGQHVNKTETRVELRWKPEDSRCLDVGQKQLIRERLANRLTSDGILSLVCDQHRSQHMNREAVQQRFLELVKLSLIPPRKRIATRPGRMVRERRLEKKRHRSELKQSRRKHRGDE